MIDSSDLESLFVRLYFDRHIMSRLLNQITSDEMANNMVHLEQFK